jgi:hypothetical protein
LIKGIVFDLKSGSAERDRDPPIRDYFQKAEKRF